MNLQLILLGAPGSGKGTQASNIINELGYNHLSTGDLLRKEISEGSNLGKRVTAIMDSGKLVDDQTVLELLNNNCNLQESSYIFDGFPRNIEQAKLLDENVLGSTTSLALFFEIDLTILTNRIVNRRTCAKCGEIYNLMSRPPKKEGVCDVCGHTEFKHRKDDNKESVKTRLDVFTSAIGPVLEYYESAGRLVKIDASMSSEEIFEKVKNVIKNHQ